MQDKKIYFFSDVHLGLHPAERSRERELLLTEWLDSIKTHAKEIYMLGDIFDFWHEYKRVVPKGFVRFLGKLAELADNGIQIHYFTGNHDIWVYDYLPKEIGLKVYRKHITREIDGQKFFIGHGDGLGPWDKKYKLLKWAFTNSLLQWMFARLHPNLALSFGLGWSKKSRYAKGIVAENFRGEDGEWQVMYAKRKLKQTPVNYFVFGHRHKPFLIKISENSRVINLGDWINNFTYGIWNGKSFEIKSIFEKNEENIIRN